jgi:PAS domain S-box-containing protein/diguanylate cyclase (GGDEF)-like protein
VPLEAMTDAGILVDASGTILAVNVRAARMLGYEPAELRGLPVERLVPHSLQSAHVMRRAEYRDRPRARPMGVGITLSALRKDGSELPVEIALTPITGPDGSTHVLAALHALGRREEWYRSMFEGLAVGIVHSDATGAFLSVNGRFCELLGYTRAEAFALDLARVTHKDDLAGSLAARQRAMSGSAPEYQFDARLICKSGAVVWTHIITSIVRHADDAAAVHFISLVQDISAHRRAEEAHARMAAIVESSDDAIVGKTLEGIITSWNAGAARLFGYDAAEAMGRSITLIVPPDRLEEELRILKRLRAGERVRHFETVRRRKDGSLVDVSLTISPVLDAQGRIVGVSKIARDITERKLADLKIRHLNRVYAVLSRINGLIVRVRGRDELFREACRIAVEAGSFIVAWVGLVDRAANRVRILACHGADEDYINRIPVGLTDAGAPGTGLAACAVATGRPVISNDMAADERILLRAESAQRGILSMVYIPLIIDEQVIGMLALYSGEIGFFDDGEMRLLNELAGDIAFAMDHLDKARRADYLAYYDQLTGLANRQLFVERLSQNVLAARVAEREVVLVLADVERLRTVNESLGRRVGDAVLKLLAARLARATAAGQPARVSGDVFAFVLPGGGDRADLERTLGAMWREIFGKPFDVGGSELTVSARAGIAVFPRDGADAETLLSSAEDALRRAKDTAETNVFHAPEMAVQSAERRTLETRLRRALEQEEFVLHYQPKLELQSRKIVGVEALLRWQSPELGVVAPMKFVPLLEETGLILQVGAWALARAVGDHRRWIELGIAAPRVAVNVSPVQMRKRDFVDRVATALTGGAATPGIDIEITESLLMEDIEESIRKLGELRERGILTAIDDFGTGYSSLSYLAKLPVQALKIDRSFILAMSEDPDTMTLVQTIISLAHSLDLKVIAEGVETDEQAKLLRLLRCDEVQGYLFGRPLPFEEITALLAQRAGG